MNSEYARAKLAQLDSIFHHFEGLQLDDYTKSEIAKYLTVLTSGMYEAIIKTLVIELANRDTVAKDVKQFIHVQVGRCFRNPSFKNLRDFLERFNKEWAKELRSKIDDKNIDALNAIVIHRNNIAHGDVSTITFSDIKQHYETSKIIIIELDNIILQRRT